jgi:hypothetical protein
MNQKTKSTTIVKLAVAAFDAYTSFRSSKIPYAEDIVRIVVLEDREKEFSRGAIMPQQS